MPTPVEPVWAVVNGITLGTPACRLRRYEQLFDSGRLRGENVVMPGAVGRRNFVRRRDEKDVTFLLQVHGRYDEEGAVNADPRLAAVEYLRYLDAGLGVGLVSVDFEFHYFGESLVGDVQVLGLNGTTFEAPDIANTTLDLVVPPTLVPAP